MKRLAVAGLTGLCVAVAVADESAPARAPVAGSTTIGVAVVQMQDVALGLSARKQILGHAVYNDQGDKVGTVDDLIVAPDKSVSFAIVGVGGFIGLRRHHVAIPVDQFSRRNGEFVLSGATKEVITSLPAFDYTE